MWQAGHFNDELSQVLILPCAVDECICKYNNRPKGNMG